MTCENNRFKCQIRRFRLHIHRKHVKSSQISATYDCNVYIILKKICGCMFPCGHMYWSLVDSIWCTCFLFLFKYFWQFHALVLYLYQFQYSFPLYLLIFPMFSLNVFFVIIIVIHRYVHIIIAWWVHLLFLLCMCLELAICFWIFQGNGRQIHFLS